MKQKRGNKPEGVVLRSSSRKYSDWYSYREESRCMKQKRGKKPEGVVPRSSSRKYSDSYSYREESQSMKQKRGKKPEGVVLTSKIFIISYLARRLPLGNGEDLRRIDMKTNKFLRALIICFLSFSKPRNAFDKKEGEKGSKDGARARLIN